jgi:hypothetical protein
MYVGSTQDGNTMRRHRGHLKENKSIGPWLRSFTVPPLPTEIRKFKFIHISRLFACENHFMRVLSTRREQGGLNWVPAGPVDHAAMGRAAHVEKDSEGKSIQARHAGKAAHATAEAKERHRSATREALWRPEVRENYLKSLETRDLTNAKLAAGRPEVRERNRETQNRPDVVAKKSEAISASWTEERRQEWTERTTGSGNPMYGKKFSEESLQRLRESHQASWTDERRAEASKQFSGEGNPRFGSTLSDETKKKIGDARRGKKWSEERRRKCKESKCNAQYYTLSDEAAAVFIDAFLDEGGK